MSTFTKVLLTIAAACLVVGIVIVGIYLIQNSGTFPAVSVPQTYTKNEMTASTLPEAIEVTDVSRDLHVVLSKDDQVHLTYYESENTGYTVKEQNGKLTVQYHQDDFMIIPNGNENRGVTLSLPASYKGTLKISVVSSDVTLHSISAGDTVITAVSGDIELYSGTSLGKTSISTTSGDLELGNATMESLTVQTVSGETEGTRLVISGDLKHSSTSGEVELRALTAENISIGTVSGEVALTLTAPAESYRYETGTVSGTVRVPQGSPTAGRTVKISTTSGDITVTAAK